jgi:hypothetical protein
MRRNSLTILILIATLTIAMASFATTPAVSGGVSITSEQDPAGLFMFVEAYFTGTYLGAWFSTTPALPQGPTCFEYRIGLTPIGVQKIRKEKFNGPCPEGAVRLEAKDDGKGRMVVTIPANTLTQGAQVFGWDMNAKDVKKTIWLLIIPIHTSGDRNLSVATYFHAQKSPDNYRSWSDREAWGHLTGFSPADAEWDPAKLAFLAALRPQNVPQNTVPANTNANTGVRTNVPQEPVRQAKQVEQVKEDYAESESEGCDQFVLSGEPERHQDKTVETVKVCITVVSSDGRCRLVWREQCVPKDWYDCMAKTNCASLVKDGRVIAWGEVNVRGSEIKICLYRGALPATAAECRGISVKAEKEE